MKAVRFHEHGGPEVLRYEEVSDPAPRPTEVLLRVKAVALNHLDVWLRKGLPGMTIPLPKIGGCDIAGDVVAVGVLCSRIAVGQRILVSPGISCGQCAACLRGDDNLCRAVQGHRRLRHGWRLRRSRLRPRGQLHSCSGYRWTTPARPRSRWRS